MAKVSTSKKDAVLKIGINKPTSEIIAAAARQGVNVSKTYVHLLRSGSTGGGTKAKSQKGTSGKATPAKKAVPQKSSGTKTLAKPAAKPATQKAPASKSVAKKAAAKPAAKKSPAKKLATKPVAKAAPKPVAKPTAKPAAKPAAPRIAVKKAVTGTGPVAKTAAKPAAKKPPAKPAPKAAAAQKAAPPKAAAPKSVPPKAAAPRVDPPAPAATSAAPANGSASTTLSKSDFIRSMPNASSAEVFAAAKKAGLSFSRALVHIVRSKGDAPQKKAGRPAGGAAKAPSSEAGEPRSKSDLIRSMPNASVGDILKAGKKAGMKFTPGYVATVRYNARVSRAKPSSSKEAPKAVPQAATSANAKSSAKPSTSEKSAAGAVAVKPAVAAAAKSSSKRRTAAGFIREHADLSHAEVAVAAKEAGYPINADYVRRMRRRDKKKGRVVTAPVAKAPSAVANVATAAAKDVSAAPSTSASAKSEQERAFLRAAIALSANRALELLRGLASLVG